MTQEERDNVDATLKHIRTVQAFLAQCAHALVERGIAHDTSKMEEPEFSRFTQAQNLKDLTYGSDAYKKEREKLGVALEHHYAHNRHHPEHHENGVNDMTLLDLTEMLADWLAAVERHDDGDIRESIRINTDRFDLSPQLAQILHNTVNALEQ